MPDERLSRAEEILDDLVAEVTAGTIELYRDVLQEPRIVFHLQDRPQGNHGLYDETVHEWLTDFGYERGHGLLCRRRLFTILRALAGRSLRSRRDEVDDPSLLNLLQTEPIVAVAYEFMYCHSAEVHEAKAEPLWKQWRQWATDRGLLKIGRKRFPGGSNVLSRQLCELKEVLAALGINVEIKRSNGSLIRLTRRSDDSANQSSGEPSSPKSKPDNENLPSDDTNAVLAKLRARQQKRNAQRDEPCTVPNSPPASTTSPQPPTSPPSDNSVPKSQPESES